jgi:hypothetical protein
VTCRHCAAIAFVAVLVLSTAACGGYGSSGSTLDRDAQTYVKLALALGARDGDSLDFYAGPKEWRDEARAAYRPLTDIRQSADALVGELDRGHTTTADESARRQFLVGQLRAIGARVDVLSGARLSFDRESELLFGIVAREHEPVDRSAVRASLEHALPGTGTLAERYAAYDRQFLIPRDKVAAVVARATDECRRITRERVTLPEGEHVSVEYVHGTPWSAFTTYEGHAHSRIRLNTDFGLTVDRALSLACHEAYPGHHTINTIVDERLVKARGRIELTVLPLFSPQVFRTEGAATYAPELAFPDDERAAFERDVLLPLAGLDPSEAARYVRVARLVDRLAPAQADIARRYLDGRLEFVRAADALAADALMIESDATLKFFNRFRTYAVTYTIGRDRAAAAVEAAGADRAAGGGAVEPRGWGGG